MGYISDLIKQSVDVSTMINIPNIIIQVIVFVAIMYVANMIYPKQRDRLIMIAIAAAFFVYFLV